jgi:hypothetical protein
VSDYLSSLVARSFNLTGELQPRLGSIFEPLHPTGGTASGHAFGLSLEDSEPAPGETPVRTISPAWMPAGRLAEWEPPKTNLKLPADKAGARPIGFQAAPGTQSSPPAGSEPAPVTPVPAGTAPARPPDQSASSSAPLRRPVPTPVSGRPSAEGVPGRTGRDRPTRSPAATRDESPVVPTPGAAERQSRPRLEPAIELTLNERVNSPAVPSSPGTESTPSSGTAGRESRTALEPANPRPEPTPVETPRPATPATVVVQPHVTPAPRAEPAGPALAGRAATPKPAPTIQVTIGRIEVRAVPPPAPPPKQRSAPPVMSLDDYLRQRDGGRR